MIRKIGWSAILVATLGACSFHASVQAGSRTASQRESDEKQQTSGKHRAARDDRPEAKQEGLAVRDQPAAEGEQAVSAPLAAEAPSAAHDHDRGHGNDADRVDEDNPGKSSKAAGKAKADKAQGDHDRGHGNDADGVDEDNPGKSKGKKGK